MDGWMDGVDLIICIAIWTLYKRRLPLTFAEARASCIASRNELRPASLFGSIFEVLGGQHGGQNSIFELLFSMFFLISFLHLFLIEFWRLETRKITIFLTKNDEFCKIGVFEKVVKNIEKGSSKIKFWPPCWLSKSSEIPPKSDAKRSLFRDAMEIARKSPQVNGTRRL